jgi:hypothetical protein
MWMLAKYPLTAAMSASFRRDATDRSELPATSKMVSDEAPQFDLTTPNPFQKYRIRTIVHSSPALSRTAAA